jgi:sodium/potassium-transporting ATPase subunit alpha
VLLIGVTRNVVFYGTYCTDGDGKGVAVRTGDLTAFGCIASATATGAKPQTLMTAEIQHFVNVISVIAIVIGVTFLILSIVIGEYRMHIWSLLNTIS